MVRLPEIEAEIFKMYCAWLDTGRGRLQIYGLLSGDLWDSQRSKENVDEMTSIIAKAYALGHFILDVEFRSALVNRATS